MKKWLFPILAGLFFACQDDSGTEEIVRNQPRFLFSALTITQTTEGTDAVIKRTFEYENNMLIRHTVEQTNTGNDRVVAYNVTASPGSHKYQCLLNGADYFYSVYNINDLSLTTTADFIYQDGEPRRYDITYQEIEGKQYIASITEYIINVYAVANVYYVLTFDYSRFDEGEIGLTQTLFGTERVRATFRITRDNEAGIPDVHLYDSDLHPLDKHYEAIHGGLLGTFDYCISEVQKETVTAVITTRETVTATTEFNAGGYPLEVISVSSNGGKGRKCYRFGYE